jgi:signal transduction histidine kinase
MDKRVKSEKLDLAEEEKSKRSDELVIANLEKAKLSAELVIANIEKAKLAAELVIGNVEKEKRASELIVADKELIYQNEEKVKRAAELVIANIEKAKRSAELVIANVLKAKLAAELVTANKELVFQNKEKAKRADELVIANKELAYQNKEKEKRVAELIITNNELNQLLQLNADKDRFISILGHDLKNPFNNILEFSEILNNEINSLSSDEIKEIAGTINKLAKITNNLLVDILSWARTQQGRIPFSPQNLSFTDICKNVVDALKPSANAKNISIDYSSVNHINVFADADMLKTTLRNLVSNAIKFTNNGGAININAKQTNSNVTIFVSDNGIGIEHDELKKLFDISEVLTTKGTAGEIGTGFGLLLCKEFVEKHGGKIWVESEIGKGSDFKFSLPVSVELANGISN